MAIEIILPKQYTQNLINLINEETSYLFDVIKFDVKNNIVKIQMGNLLMTPQYIMLQVYCFNLGGDYHKKVIKIGRICCDRAANNMVISTNFSKKMLNYFVCEDNNILHTYYWKIMDEWIPTYVNKIFNHIIIIEGNDCRLVKNLIEYKKNVEKMNTYTQEQNDIQNTFLTKIIKKENLITIFNKFAKKQNISWSEFNNHQNALANFSTKSINQMLLNKLF